MDTDDPRSILAMLIVGIAGAYSTVVLPLIVSSATQRLQLSGLSAGAIASMEMGGIAVGTLLAGLRMPTANRRHLVIMGALLAVAANLAVLQAQTLPLFLTVRFVAGLGAGIQLATMAAGIGATTHAERNFGIFVALAFAIATASFRYLRNTDATTVFLVLAGISLGGLLAAASFPRYAPRSEATPASNSATPMQRMSGAARIALGGILAYYVGIGGVWPLMGRIGSSLGVSTAASATILSRASIAALAGAIAAAVLATNLDRRVAVTAGLTSVAAALVWLAVVPSAAVFQIQPLLFLLAWNFTVPYLMGTVAALDPSGRAVAMNMTLQYVGFACGPLLAGFTVQRGGLGLALWLGAGGVILSLALFTLAVRGASHPNRAS